MRPIMLQCIFSIWLSLTGANTSLAAEAINTLDAKGIIESAMDHWRGVSSYSEMTMTIHRPSWQRSMSLRGWTQGKDNSLVRVTAPAKDVGNGTLILDQDMWTYSPKINRIIKVPSSMMGQSWMGSDFSNRDVARDDDILDEYTHTLLQTTQDDGFTVYHIEAIPHPTAAVVWGRQVIQVREDFVLLREDYYDQDDALVKSLVTKDIKTMGGRTVAARQRMSNIEKPEEWTEIIMETIDFDIDLNAQMFSLSNLRNPRQ